MTVDTIIQPVSTSEGAGLRIGLALSGGGLRAAVFHLGVIARLAAEKRCERVSAISSVSGGSLITALIFAHSGWLWPSSTNMLSKTLPAIRQTLTSRSIQRNMFLRGLLQPWRLKSARAKCLSDTLRYLCGVDRKLQDLPDQPVWLINATSYESGKNWRFTKGRMGDYVLNYVEHPDISIADAVAASAAYPGLIGPLVLKAKFFCWHKRRNWKDTSLEPTQATMPKIHLWDGGIYDNLGGEALFKPQGGLKAEYCDFFIVSDADAGLSLQKSRLVLRPAFRLVYIAMDQVRSLRARSVVSAFEQGTAKGAYLRIGNTARYILSECGIPDTHAAAVRPALAHSQVEIAKKHRTDLRRLTPERFDLLLNHGWEVADCTLFGRHPTLFSPTGYNQ
jgi:NTE family protein